MPLQYKSGQTINVIVDFYDGDFFVPDVGSVSWSLYDATGSLVTGPISVFTTSTTTRISITISSVYNTIPSGDITFKKITVYYTRDTFPGSFDVIYQLYTSFNTWVTPENVREYLGMTPRELPDSSVDVLAAYNAIRSRLTSSVFDAALVSGDSKTYAINNAIKAQAAYQTIPGLKFRYTYKESDGSLTYQRLQNIDLDELSRKILEDLDNYLTQVDSQAALVTSYSVLERSVRTDPVTGA